MAAMLSADLLLGTAFCTKNKMSDINRRLGYRRGASTSIDAPVTSHFSRFVAAHGLSVHRETSASNALDHLKQLVSADDCSFPVVGVDLELVRDYDQRVSIRRASGAATSPPSTDHALLILSIDRDAVDFIDPTLRDPGASLVMERVDLPTFLRRWGQDPIVPFDRLWFTKTEGKPVKAKAEAKKTLYSFGAARRATGRRKNA